MYVLRSPNKTGSLSRNWYIASSNYSRLSRVDGGRYAPIIGTGWSLETILQIAMFGPWKRMYSKIHTSGFSLDIIYPPCAPLASVTVALEQTT